MRHRHTAKHWVLKGVLFLVFGGAAAVVFTWIAMTLWNWLMPELFGLKLLTFWQTLGLLALSWIFFGRFRGLGHGGHHRWKHRMAERWMRMSPEQRQELHRQMHERWHEDRHNGHPTAPGDAK